MTTPAPARRMVIVGCSAHKVPTITPVAALDLYQGWCVPELRTRVAGHSRLREHILVLSGQHGLIHADTLLLPYDQPLIPQRVADLHSQVHRAWVRETQHAVVDELLLLLEPAYLELIGPSILHHPPAVAHWIPDPTQAWEHATTVLDRWGWPPASSIEANEGNAL